MEYKGDERYMVEVARTAGRTAPWPAVGMPSGVSVPNPGLSVWAFVGLARVTGAETPVGLDRAVQGLNVLALVLLLGMAWRRKDARERAAWLWAFAFVAVSPIEVIYERKIWAQSILPFFCLLFLGLRGRRARAGGAFGWGLVGAVLGQIHMSGFFYAAATALWTALFPRERTRWRAWFLGSAVGVLPMVPWLLALVRGAARETHGFAWTEPFQLKFWGYWVMNVFGVGVADRLGIDAFKVFLRTPLLASGTGTWLAAVSQAGEVLAGVSILWVGFRRRGLTFFLGGESEAPALFLFGGLLTLSAVAISRHYLIVAYPLAWVWLGRAAEIPSARRWLVLSWAMQLLTTILFLYFVHTNGGASGGDYGPSFRMQ